MNLFEVYESGAVIRYHTKRTAGARQTVADHTWGMLVVLRWLYEPLMPPMEHVWQTVFHDCPELITGDVPAPAKWRSPELAQALTAVEIEVANEMGVPADVGDVPTIRYCDNAELAMHSLAQARMGNQFYLASGWKGTQRMRLWFEKLDSGVRPKALDLIETIEKGLESCSSNK